MPYGEVTSNPDGGVYVIGVLDGEGRGLEFRAKAGNHPASVYTGVFQHLVTLIDGSPEIFVGDARVEFSASQQVTAES